MSTLLFRNIALYIYGRRGVPLSGARDDTGCQAWPVNGYAYRATPGKNYDRLYAEYTVHGPGRTNKRDRVRVFRLALQDEPFFVKIAPFSIPYGMVVAIVVLLGPK